MAQENFHTVAPIEEATKAQKGLTKFVGNGTPILELPGCKKVRRVFIGEIELPETIEELEPHEHGVIPGKVEQRLWKLDKDGPTPILLRSKKSNDGIWQEGQAVFIDGDFAKDAPVSPDTKKAEEAKAAADAKAKADAEAKKAEEAKSATAPETKKEGA
jgi:hypothetical protein